MRKTIHTERLTLRPSEVKDVYTSFEYTGNADNTRYMMYLPYKSIDEAKNYLRKAEEEWDKPDDSASLYHFMIIMDGRNIGDISLEPDGDRYGAELGWVIHRDFWGRGITTEAALAVKDFAVNELGIKKLYAHCDSRNIGSYRVMEHIGMTLERDDGVRYDKLSGEPVKEFMYSLTV